VGQAVVGETRTVRAFVAARRHTDHLFQFISGAQWYERPVPERHRLVFYLGHIDAFDWNLIGRHACRLPSFHPAFDRLFAFGIDPHTGEEPQDQASDWPAVSDVRRYVDEVRRRLDAVVREVDPVFLDVAIEHRLMHAETFTYLIHNLSAPVAVGRIAPPPSSPSSSPPLNTMIEIPAGTARLGRQRPAAEMDTDSFGWDNEFGQHVVSVPRFRIRKHKVTNGEYLKFVEAGADPPHFWRRAGTGWLWRTVWGEIPLPLDWPVYVTWHGADRYARWVGQSLPTEAEFHRAAYGTPQGDERAYPWGDAAPDPRHGNFDCRYWDPLPVTATPAGDSAFGVSQLVGNGWEWTQTIFTPFPDFQPFPFYPGYSAPFFDGRHYVLKGASPRTAARLIRRSFRNWFRPNYPYVYASFRCVEN